MATEVEMLKGPAKGSRRTIGDSKARALVRVGYARLATQTYATRHMEPASTGLPAAAITPAPASSCEPVTADEYDAMDPDALRALANARGLNVHHRAGAEKIRSALRDQD